MNKSKFKIALFGFLIGIVNGLFGSGGGVLAVPMLESSGLEPKKSHASSVAVMLVLSTTSLILYTIKGSVSLEEGLTLAPFGVAGALLGAKFLKNVKTKTLKRIFGVFLILAGGRTLFL